tara:strand:- start:141 stop:722 length:582 start_codon:yes stop_codon:yes gene_type:complete
VPDLKSTLYNINVKSIIGEEQKLSKYLGRVLLIVNVASKCGFTSQYAGLQKLYEKYSNQGLCVLAFPSNDFGGQEPGDNKEIESFCIKKYGVSFDLFSKVHVIGPQQSSLYKYLQDYKLTPVVQPGIKMFLMGLITKLLLRIRGDILPKDHEVKWNFNKFLVDKKGYPVARYSSEIEPDSPTLIKQIEVELAK